MADLWCRLYKPRTGCALGLDLPGQALGNAHIRLACDACLLRLQSILHRSMQASTRSPGFQTPGKLHLSSLLGFFPLHKCQWLTRVHETADTAPSSVTAASASPAVLEYWDFGGLTAAQKYVCFSAAGNFDFQMFERLAIRQINK